jgi:hypothetical protein
MRIVTHWILFLSISIFIFRAHAFPVAKTLEEAKQSLLVLRNPFNGNALGQGIAINLIDQPQSPVIAVATVFHLAVYYLVGKEKNQFSFKGKLCDEQHINQGYRFQKIDQFGLRTPSSKKFFTAPAVLVIPCNPNNATRINQLFEDYIALLNKPVKKVKGLPIITDTIQDLSNFCLSGEDSAVILANISSHTSGLTGLMQSDPHLEQISATDQGTFTFVTDLLTRSVKNKNHPMENSLQSFSVSLIPMNSENSENSKRTIHLQGAFNIVPGDSGAPLFDQAGKAVAMVSCTLRREAIYDLSLEQDNCRKEDDVQYCSRDPRIKIDESPNFQRPEIWQLAVPLSNISTLKSDGLSILKKHYKNIVKELAGPPTP